MLAAADSLMAFIARVVNPAAMEFDGDAIDFRMVMRTACFRVYINSFYNKPMCHSFLPFFQKTLDIIGFFF